MSNESLPKSNRLKEDTVLIQFKGYSFHLGYSRISKFIECPKSYKFSYIDGIRQKDSVAMSRGTAYHNTLEALLDWKILHDDHVKIETAIKAAHHFSRGESLSNSEAERVVRAIDFYHENMYRQHKPLAVEKDFKIKRGGVEITGRVDLIETTGSIIDHKFSYDTWASSRAKYGAQPIIYQWAGIDVFEKMYPGWTYENFAYNIIRLFPTPLIQVLEIPRVSQDESDWYEEQIEMMAKAIEAEAFFAKPSENGCKWCSYKDICKPTVYTTNERFIGYKNSDEEDDF